MKIIKFRDFIRFSDWYFYFHRHINGHLREVLTHVKYIFRHKTPEKKFIIFGLGRSGSTLLTTLFNSHPDIFCDKEILSGLVRNEKLYRKKREAVYSSSKDVYGFKLLVPHMLDYIGGTDDYLRSYMLQYHTPTENARYLQELVDDGYKIIYLKRKNILDMCVSFHYGKFRKHFHTKSGNKDLALPKMTIDRDKFLLRSYGTMTCGQIADQAIQQVPHIAITYEDDLLDNDKHPETMKKLYEYIGVEYHTPVAGLKKVRSKNNEDIIENYDEFEQFIKDTPFKDYL